MLISRGVNLLNHVSKHAKRKNMLSNIQPTRFSHEWLYRPTPQIYKMSDMIAKGATAILVWWELHRFSYDYTHFTSAHWPFLDSSKWTDEELGIPPDDSD